MTLKDLKKLKGGADTVSGGTYYGPVLSDTGKKYK